MKIAKTYFVVIVFGFLMLACGAQPLTPESGGIKGSEKINDVPGAGDQLGGSEVTNPYLRKVFGRIETEDKNCPYEAATAISTKTSELFEVSVSETCQFETRLPGGDSYSFEFAAGDTALQLVFENGQTAVFVEPVIEDKDLGVFVFSEAVMEIVRKYEEQKKAREEFGENYKRVRDLDDNLPEFEYKYFEPKGDNKPLDNNTHEFLNKIGKPQTIEAPAINMAPKQPVFPNH